MNGDVRLGICEECNYEVDREELDEDNICYSCREVQQVGRKVRALVVVKVGFNFPRHMAVLDRQAFMKEVIEEYLNLEHLDHWFTYNTLQFTLVEQEEVIIHFWVEIDNFIEDTSMESDACGTKVIEIEQCQHLHVKEWNIREVIDVEENVEEVEMVRKVMSSEDFMYDYALWVGTILVNGGTSELTPFDYMEYRIEMVGIPTVEEAKTFLGQFYSEIEIEIWAKELAWDE